MKLNGDIKVKTVKTLKYEMRRWMFPFSVSVDHLNSDGKPVVPIISGLVVGDQIKIKYSLEHKKRTFRLFTRRGDEIGLLPEPFNDFIHNDYETCKKNFAVVSKIDDTSRGKRFAFDIKLQINFIVEENYVGI